MLGEKGEAGSFISRSITGQYSNTSRSNRKAVKFAARNEPTASHLLDHVRLWRIGAPAPLLPTRCRIAGTACHGKPRRRYRSHAWIPPGPQPGHHSRVKVARRPVPARLHHLPAGSDACLMYAIKSLRSSSFRKPAKAILVPGMKLRGFFKYSSNTSSVQTRPFLPAARLARE